MKKRDKRSVNIIIKKYVKKSKNKYSKKSWEKKEIKY